MCSVQNVKYDRPFRAQNSVTLNRQAKTQMILINERQRKVTYKQKGVQE